MNACAFSRANPFGAQLNAIYSSDIGHFDVIDMRDPLPEAWELVEDGLITADNFRDFTFTNAVRLWGTQVRSSPRKRRCSPNRPCAPLRNNEPYAVCFWPVSEARMIMSSSRWRVTAASKPGLTGLPSRMAWPSFAYSCATL